MDFPHSDDGSTLVSLETSSFLSPSLRGSPSESNLPAGEELIRSVPRSLRTEMSSVGDDVEVDDVLVVHDTIAAETRSPAYIRDRAVALLKDPMTIDFASHAVVGDDDVVEAKGSMAVESGSPDVAPDDDSVVLVAAMEVQVASPVVVQDKDVVVAEEAMTFEGKLPAQGNDVVVVQDAMAVEFAYPGVVCTNKDVVAVQEQDSWHCARPRSGHSSPPVVGLGVEVASLVVDNNVVMQGLASPSCARIRNACSTPPILVDDPGAGQQKEGMEYLVNDGSLNVEGPAPVLLPVVPEVPQVEEQVLNVTETSLIASDETSPRENPNSSVGAKISSMKESEGVSKFLAPEETDDMENEYTTTVLVDDSCARPHKEGLDCPVHDGSSIVGRAASVSLPVVSDIPMAEEQTLNFAETSSKALEGASPCGSPGSSAGMKLSSMKGLAGALMLVTPGETDHTDDEYFSTPVVADKSGTGPHEEGLECRVHDGSSMVERHASVSSPAISEIPESEEQVSNAAEISSKAFEEATPRGSPSSLADAKLSSMKGAECASTLLVPEELDHVDDEAVHEQQPAKRVKTNGTIYSGADAVTIVLGQTAEMVLVLAGMAQMRAGRIPTSYERELAATAYQNLAILVSQVAPNNLVGKESLERILQYYTLKKVAQKKREDQAWFEALTEAEAIANVRAEALARAKAEAAARAQAELAARAKAEAEEPERRQQAALKAAAVAAANGLGKGDLCSVGSSPLPSGQSTYRLSEVAQSPTPPTPRVHPSSQAEMGSLVQLPPSKAGEVPLLVTQSEKIMSVNGQPYTPASKPTLGRPPKVRNRVRKEAAGVTLFAPEFLNVVQSQVPDPQKAHVTHKELCLGVQQFIREHIPPISQNLQALPPTYISPPFPCQVCKLIAKDTGSVLVCDSCDEVSHVKCVQPPSRGASKGDWNCPKCLTASRGAKCPAKYGPIRHGSPNSVKLWPPHDLCQGDPEPTNSRINGSVRGGDELAAAGRQSGSGQLTAQGKASLEIDTRGHQSMDDQSTGNFGSSPHLIVHLVNEPSPRTNNPFNRSSDSFRQEGLEGPVPSGKSISAFVQETSSAMDLTKNVAIENQTQVQGKTGITIPGQSDGLISDTESQSFEEALQKSESQSAAGVVEDSVHEKNRRAAPAHIKKTETRTQATQRRKGNMESVMISPGKQAEVPLPIVMEWVGDSIRRAEGKVYYLACSVGGLAFSVSDCALFRPETPDVPPYIARLQVLWEDIATGHKWVRVSWCYYPTDIPLAMGRPGTTAPDEVYESNHCDNNLLGSIQGPCFVLPPLKFIEETERRRSLEKRGDAVEELPPIFLSRWMYDAPKGVFKPLQE